MKLENIKTKFFFSNLFFMFFLLIITFGRPFSGIFILNYRIGELIVAFGVLVYLFLVFHNINIFIKRSEYSKLFILQTLLVVLFLSTLVPPLSHLINPYVYKSSNYIWTISYIFIGVFIKRYLIFNKIHLFIINFFLLFSYFLSVIYYPQFIVDFFFIHADKFDFLKAHMHLLFLVIVSTLNLKYSNNKQLNSYYFILLSGLFLPLLIFKSRGSFLSFTIFIFLYLFLNINYLKNSIMKLFVVIAMSIILFVQSSILVSGVEADINDTVYVINNIIENKETKNTFFSFFISEGRVYSNDGNINWRLQIWQDVLIDSKEPILFFWGYGFTELIPAMDIPSRGGTDGNNENVHNYFFNIFARGGFSQLLLVLYIYFYLIQYLTTLYPKALVISVVFPILCVSFFDASMENPHFPALFYLFIGFIQEKNYYNKLNNKDIN